jgi:hypothetical protein
MILAVLARLCGAVCRFSRGLRLRAHGPQPPKRRAVRCRTGGSPIFDICVAGAT